MPTSDGYRWWPSHQPLTVENDLKRIMVWEILVELVLAAILCLPPVTHVTGIAPVAVLFIIGGHLTCALVVSAAFRRRKLVSRVAFDLQLALEILYNTATALLLVAFTGDPRTPLWLGVSLYACLLGAQQEFDASLAILLFLIVAPLATIPLFLAVGAPASWAVVAPVINACFCALGYHLLAMRAMQWRRLRGEQAAEIDRLRLRAADLERQQLARDLHDSVGSALSLVGMYGDLVERHRHEPEELARIAATLREATHEGLGDLRGVLDAMAPVADDLDALAGNLDRIGGRVTSATGIEIVVSVTGDRTQAVAAGLSLGVVRLFQEAVHNAVRHGRPSVINARVAMERSRLTLEVSDDGEGFDPTKVSPGRGLSGMRARTEALGGTLIVDASPARGTSIKVEIPRAISRARGPAA